MTDSTWWREVVRCPVDRGRLVVGATGLTCTVCGHEYPLVGGIPDLRPPAAQASGDDAH